MSLINSMMDSCTILNKITESDGEGGSITSWKDGAEVECAIVLDASLSARIAEKEGFTNVYTITTRKNVQLDFHDVIRRNYDGKIFRVTSDGSDKTSPKLQAST